MTFFRAVLTTASLALCAPCVLGATTSGDFDGDGRDELLLRNVDTRAWIYYDLEDGRGQAQTLPLPASEDQRFLGIGDFNGDGRDDILFVEPDTRSWTYYAPQAPGSEPRAVVSEALPVTSNATFRFRGVGDLDGDGHDDLLLRNMDNGVWIAYLMGGAGPEVRRGLGVTPRRDYAFAGLGDFNGDGRDDLLLRHETRGAWVSYEMLADVRGVLRRPGLTRNESFALRGIGDLNGDGRDDLLLRNRSSGEWISYEVNGSRVVLRRGFGMPRDRAVRRMAVGDFDGDGDASVIARNVTVGNWTEYELSGSNAVETGYSGVYRDPDWRADYALAAPDDADTVRRTDDGRVILELSLDDTTVENPFDLNERTIVFTPNGQWAYTHDVRPGDEWEDDQAERIRDGDKVELPFSFEFAGRTWNSVYVSRRGVLSFEEKFEDPYLMHRFASMREYARLIGADPVISALYKPTLGGAWTDYELYVATFPERVVVTWPADDYHSWPHGVDPGDESFVQAVLDADGDVTFRYRGITSGDGVVGLFPGVDDDDGVTRGDPLLEISDPADPELPGYLDLTAVTIHESGVQGTVLVEFTTRDAIDDPGEGQSYSYRLSFDSDQPHWSQYDFGDLDFQWIVSVGEDGEPYAFNGTALPREDPNRIALLVDLARFEGIGGSVIASAVEFHDSTPVTSSDSMPVFVQLPLEPPPLDLSAGGSGGIASPAETFHYRGVASTQDLACRVTERFGDVFDGIVLHADFRLDNQEGATAWISYEARRPISGIGVRNAQTPPCEAARLKGVWSHPVWTHSTWVANDSVQEAERFDHGLTLFAHEFSHFWLASFSYDREGGPETLTDSSFHWRPGLHTPAAFPWKADNNFATSTHGGRFWRANPDGTYTPALLDPDAGGFSFLDLYVMGLADASEVPNTFYLRNLEPLDEDDPWGPHTADRERVTIQQIIASEGERDPTRSEAPTVFNIAFVYLLEPGADAPDARLFELHRDFRDKVLEHWAHVTGERSELTTVVPKPSESPRPARVIRPPDFVPGVARHRH